LPFKCDLQRYNAVRKKPKDWIPDKCWLDLVALSQLATFHDLLDSFTRNEVGVCTLNQVDP
jgi:hypothetical protein